MAANREAELYAPVKRFLESQGYTVKGEVAGNDVVAVRGDEPPVVVELKTAFTLPLLFQGVARQRLTDAVYLAVPDPGRGTRHSLWRRHYRDIVKLCRMLGLGLMTVRTAGRGAGRVDVHADPAPYRPRKSKARRAMLLAEFQRRAGDPNTGGTNRRGIVTAYRQDALRCARHLDGAGPSKASEVAQATGVERARGILYRDAYGWVERVERGVYALTPAGVAGLDEYAAAVAALDPEQRSLPAG